MRRPSHADKRRAWRGALLGEEIRAVRRPGASEEEIRASAERLPSGAARLGGPSAEGQRQVQRNRRGPEAATAAARSTAGRSRPVPGAGTAVRLPRLGRIEVGPPGAEEQVFVDNDLLQQLKISQRRLTDRTLIKLRHVVIVA
jgi:hypothetical protein